MKAGLAAPEYRTRKTGKPAKDRESTASMAGHGMST